MTRAEFSNWAKAMKTFYPRENFLPNQEALDLWFGMLKDIPYPVLEAAASKYVLINKFSPTIAELRELATEIMQDEGAEDWSVGWEKAILAISKYGWYGTDEALASLDPITRETVRRIGYEHLCHSENVVSERANFKAIYEVVAKRRKEDRQIPNDLRNIIAKVKENLMIEEAKHETD